MSLNNIGTGNTTSDSDALSTEDSEDSEQESSDSYKPGGYHPVNIGDTFKNGRYIIISKMGWGQFSTVWLVWDRLVKLYVAMKISRSAQRYIDAAVDEIILLERIRKNCSDNSHHHHVIQMIEYFTHRGPNGIHVCIVLEILGSSLLSLIRYHRNTGVPLKFVKELTRQILLATDYLHDICGIIHCDIKPENILLYTKKYDIASFYSQTHGFIFEQSPDLYLDCDWETFTAQIHIFRRHIKTKLGFPDSEAEREFLSSDFSTSGSDWETDSDSSINNSNSLLYLKSCPLHDQSLEMDSIADSVRYVKKSSHNRRIHTNHSHSSKILQNTPADWEIVVHSSFWDNLVDEQGTTVRKPEYIHKDPRSTILQTGVDEFLQIEGTYPPSVHNFFHRNGNEISSFGNISNVDSDSLATFNEELNSSTKSKLSDVQNFGSDPMSTASVQPHKRKYRRRGKFKLTPRQKVLKREAKVKARRIRRLYSRYQSRLIYERTMWAQENAEMKQIKTIMKQIPNPFLPPEISSRQLEFFQSPPPPKPTNLTFIPKRRKRNSNGLLISLKRHSRAEFYESHSLHSSRFNSRPGTPDSGNSVSFSTEFSSPYTTPAVPNRTLQYSFHHADPAITARAKTIAPVMVYSDFEDIDNQIRDVRDSRPPSSASLLKSASKVKFSYSPQPFSTSKAKSMIVSSSPEPPALQLKCLLLYGVPKLPENDIFRINSILRSTDLHCKIVDFGNSCWINHHFSSNIQTRQYRSPEIILGAPYNERVDMWSIACTVFEIATTRYLFDPVSGSTWSCDEDHLAQCIELLGNVPNYLIRRGYSSRQYFDRMGRLRNIDNLSFMGLYDILHQKYRFSRHDSLGFSSFLTPLLEFDPINRVSAEQSLQHPWLRKHHPKPSLIPSTLPRPSEKPALPYPKSYLSAVMGSDSNDSIPSSSAMMVNADLDSDDDIPLGSTSRNSYDETRYHSQVSLSSNSSVRKHISPLQSLQSDSPIKILSLTSTILDSKMDKRLNNIMPVPDKEFQTQQREENFDLQTNDPSLIHSFTNNYPIPKNSSYSSFTELADDPEEDSNYSYSPSTPSPVISPSSTPSHTSIPFNPPPGHIYSENQILSVSSGNSTHSQSTPTSPYQTPRIHIPRNISSDSLSDYSSSNSQYSSFGHNILTSFQPTGHL